MTEPRWLDDDQLNAWKKFVAVVELLPGVLDSQLQRDAELSHFEYFVLAMLSESPQHVLRMTALASATNATLPRLSHVASRLEKKGYIERRPCPEDKRATNAHLTEAGMAKVVATAPGHVNTVRDNVIDPLDATDIADLDRIMGRILDTLDPDHRFARPAR
ncbi:MarR family winged helix-turn-helix transcriptional regulator [Mycetocola zhujimingii]|uniref:MarR family winged helix-turn-helix transcriptional regulator n=1 Tax=Mycetocola zhujimingii TaxID=2079792 RepID=UPI000D35F1CD|nr:MarR family transcriptional regulator [Mycetocola zhujimingii]AWB87771.1 MarR family transcriptional regulator [Mycetocola zhujimingii]